MRAGTDKPYVQVTAGLIWQEGRVLIAKRPEGTHLEGYWEFPGGKQKPGESLRDCLEREIREELGLTVRADEEVGTVEHEYYARVVCLHFFNCTCLAGEPRPLESQQLRWVHPVDLPKFTFPPPDREVIELLASEGLPERGA